ncbi:ALF repeat-containing protein [Kitasatospora sp. NPDC086801]|uniref:ALF repeat-containing protein n=1 Tax=Kitasatospora sp. NPDC086801 TaxID=3364066 RepID=UPI00382264EB
MSVPRGAAGRRSRAGRAHFLAVEADRIRRDDARIAILRTMNTAGPAVKKAANAAFGSNDLDVFRAYLNVGQYTARAEDENRAKVQGILADAGTGRHVREAAKKALAGSAADVEHFLKAQLEPLRASDDRIRVSQLIEAGGPEVRKAGLAALDGGIADVRAFLKEGQFTARAKDEAAAKTMAETATETTRSGSGTTRAVTTVTPDATVAPVSVTTGTTTTAAATTTDDRGAAGGSLAATGSTAPLGQLGAAAGAAVALGAGAVVASRRRSQA